MVETPSAETDEARERRLALPVEGGEFQRIGTFLLPAAIREYNLPIVALGTPIGGHKRIDEAEAHPKNNPIEGGRDGVLYYLDPRSNYTMAGNIARDLVFWRIIGPSEDGFVRRHCSQIAAVEPVPDGLRLYRKKQ